MKQISKKQMNIIGSVTIFAIVLVSIVLYFSLGNALTAYA